MKTSRLTDKHFNSRNVQRFHEYLNRDLEPYSDRFLLSLLVLPTFTFCVFPNMVGEEEWSGLGLYFFHLVLFLFPGAGLLVNSFVVCIGFTIVQVVSHIFYRLPSSKSEIILINPHGNPEMCKITKYPAIDFYGYRLPNAGDIEKIEKFMKSA